MRDSETKRVKPTRTTRPGFQPEPMKVSSKTTKKVYTELILRDDQKEVAEYLLSLNNDINMVATFIQESWLNPYATGSLDERWICQLMPIYNPVVYEDKWKNDWEYQAEQCVKKRNAVVDKNIIWSAYKLRFKYLK